MPCRVLESYLSFWNTRVIGEKQSVFAPDDRFLLQILMSFPNRCILSEPVSRNCPTRIIDSNFELI